MTPRSFVVDVMIQAARLAGEGLRSDFGRLDLLEVHHKGPSDYVSSADLRSQETLRQALSSAFPDHALLMEEGEVARDAAGEPRFVVDPLDGTTNFLHGIPHFAISVGLQVRGEMTAGVVLNPMSGELYWAEKGKGAWLGDRRLQVSRATALDQCIVATGIPHRGRGQHAPYLQALSRVMAEVAGIRRCGAAALDLAFVAAGRFDAFFELGLAPWDVAAGTLLVREAGGWVTQCDGAETRVEGQDILACASTAVQAAMIRVLGPIHRESQKG